jgi:ribonuclease kappa
MGIFFYMKSVALVEDLPLKEEYKPEEYERFFADVDQAYSQNAFNCWIAACLYVGTFLISAHQFYVNNKSTTAASF